MKQHNGLRKGGAFRTKTLSKRPWKMICLVSGFQSKISALQFEHAWQHPHITRHISSSKRIVKSLPQLYGNLDKYIGNMLLLIESCGFQRCDLKIHVFEQNVMHALDQNKYQVTLPKIIKDLGTEATTNCDDGEIGGGLLTKYLKSSLSLSTDSTDISKNNATVADIALTEQLYYQHSLSVINVHSNNSIKDNCSEKVPIAVCIKCSYSCPMTELADRFISEDQVLPISGNCPHCSTTLPWNLVSKNAYRLLQPDNSRDSDTTSSD